MTGTAGGGMDHTISIFSEKDTAKFIDFVPDLKVSSVVLPRGISFVIANTLTPSTKNVSRATRYNKRVVECRLATTIIAMNTGLCSTAKECKVKTLQQLQQALERTSEQMIELTHKILPEEVYTKEELTVLLKCELFEILSDVNNSDEVLQVNDDFKLRFRACHAFGESQRVLDFRSICNTSEISDEENIKMLGDLMNRSHTSSRDLYESSAPLLNELTDLCRKSGAVGSRLTGAGWGGCCVSLVKTEDLEGFLEGIKEYYTKWAPEDEKLAGMSMSNFKEHVFISNPPQGACVIYCKTKSE